MSARAPGFATLAAAAALSVAAAGCGKSDQQQVRDTLKRYERATARQDYDALCSSVLARSLIARRSAAYSAKSPRWQVIASR